MKKNVLLIPPTIEQEGIDILESECNVYYAPDKKEETLIRCINEHNIDGIFTRIEVITRKIIESCKSLKVIIQHGSGVDNIDVNAASENGVMVLNLQEAVANPVAEHAFALMLDLSRNILQADKNIRAGNWIYREECRRYQVELLGKNLFIIGLGSIGKRIAKKGIGFEMEASAYDPYVPNEIMKELGVQKVENLIEGMKLADYIVIVAPMSKETNGMISKEHIKAMKKSAYIINLGRGVMIDNEALLEALKNHEIAGAGLDVFTKTPVTLDNPFLQLNNVVLTPHLGGGSVESLSRCATIGAKTLIEALNGGKPFNIYHLQPWDEN